MKKQTKRIISLILSCLMIFSGMTLSVFAETTHNVQVIKAPADGASYGKLNTSYSGVNDIPFKIKPDSGYTGIEVTTDYGDTIFTADAESLTPDADGSVSFHVNTSKIDRVGNNTLTLTVYYDDGNWTQDYNVFIQPQYSMYAYDNNSLKEGDTIDATNYANLDYVVAKGSSTYTVEMIDGEKCFKILNLQAEHKYLHKSINCSGDFVISYDFYAGPKCTKDNMTLKIQLYTDSTNKQYFASSLSDYSGFLNGKWYTIRYTINSTAGTITRDIISNGVVEYTKTADVNSSNINSNNEVSITAFRVDAYCDANWSPTNFFGLDNYKVYKNIPVNASLKYTAGGEEVFEDKFLNGKVSENADSITATLGGDISGEPTITLYKGDEAVTSDATVDGAEITFSNLSLVSGASYKIKVENVKIASMSLQGYIEIPFETTNLANDIKESCTVSVNNEGSLKAGKVMTVNGTLYPEFESAEIQFDGAKIEDLSVTSDNSYSVRYLIPDNVSGSHTVKLVASYEALNEAVVKEQSITVCEKDAPDNSSTIDFEKYSKIVDTEMTHNEAKTNITDAKLFGDKPTYSISSDAGRGYILKAVNNTQSWIGVANAFAEFYALPDKSVKTNGKLGLEFDFYISQYHFGNYFRITYYDNSGTLIAQKDIMADGAIAGVGNLPAGWHTFKGEFNLDTMKFSYIINNNQDTYKQTNIGANAANGISYYRIALTMDEIGQYWALDNIKFTYSESPIYASASYVKDDAEFAASKVISCDAEAIKLNVRKEYKAFSENDVTVAINGVSHASKDAVYSDGTITVPLTSLSIKEGDAVKLTVSHDAYLADGSQVDEPVVVEFVAGDSDGRAIIVENGKAKAYFGINANVAENATVYVVAYNGDALESLTSSEVSISEGASSYESTGLTLPSDYDEIKCFVWTGDDIKPLIKPIIKQIIK